MILVASNGVSVGILRKDTHPHPPGPQEGSWPQQAEGRESRSEARVAVEIGDTPEETVNVNKT